MKKIHDRKQFKGGRFDLGLQFKRIYSITVRGENGGRNGGQMVTFVSIGQGAAVHIVAIGTWAAGHIVSTETGQLVTLYPQDQGGSWSHCIHRNKGS